MEMLKNRNTQIALGVILLVVLGLGGYFFLAGNTEEKPEVNEFANESAVKTLSAEEIGLSLEVSPDGNQVKFLIEKAQGIESIEYEMTYEADSTAAEQSDGASDRIQRGITGEAEVKSGKTSFESEWLDLGSCSRNICKYDTGVESMEITLKLTKEDGVYQVEDTVEL